MTAEVCDEARVFVTVMDYGKCKMYILNDKKGGHWIQLTFYNFILEKINSILEIHIFIVYVCVEEEIKSNSQNSCIWFYL